LLSPEWPVKEDQEAGILSRTAGSPKIVPLNFFLAINSCGNYEKKRGFTFH